MACNGVHNRLRRYQFAEWTRLQPNATVVLAPSRAPSPVMLIFKRP